MHQAREWFQDSGPGKREGPAGVSSGPFVVPGNDLLSRGKHYHRPRMLNGRVRKGNGCGHPGLVTGSLTLYQEVAVRVAPGVSGRHCLEGGINAVKRSAVSTGRLSGSPRVHVRPIDLVVFQEPSPVRAGDLILGEVSRLDAFSVYPRH